MCNDTTSQIIRLIELEREMDYREIEKFLDAEHAAGKNRDMYFYDKITSGFPGKEWEKYVTPAVIAYCLHFDFIESFSEVLEMINTQNRSTPPTPSKRFLKHFDLLRLQDKYSAARFAVGVIKNKTGKILISVATEINLTMQDKIFCVEWLTAQLNIEDPSTMKKARESVCAVQPL